ncbi:MAG: YitT family protein [Butyricimonas faecihominis]
MVNILLKEKPFTREWFRTYALLIGGAFVLALGYSCFMAPYKIVPGGIYGITIVLQHKWGFPIGIAALCFNLPLSLLGLRVLGSGFGVKTFICFILVAVFSDSLPALLLTLMGEPIPTDPMVALDPFKLGDEVLLACIFGGVVMGVGVGMIMRTRASSGGTDCCRISPQVDSSPVGTVADDGRFMYRSSVFSCFRTEGADVSGFHFS